MKNKYDLIFGIGEACSCTQSLRDSDLQVYSYPFDWLFGSDFIGRCKILASKFDRFIEKDDLKLSHEERSINCIAYYNKYNDITFNHDFLKTLDFDEAYIQVKNKYDRRIERLLGQIDNSAKILVVYLETPTSNHVYVSDETIMQGYNIIKSAFDKDVDLLYISNSNNEKQIRKIANNITKIVDNYKSTVPNALDFWVDMKKMQKVLKCYKLNLPFSYYIKKNLVKLLINFVPKKSLRFELRKKCHV